MASQPPASGSASPSGAPASNGSGLPGILYYDPNTTTAKLATAGLRLAGFSVFNAYTLQEAVELCKKHGPAGDRTVMALLLDAAADPNASAAVLKALVQIPGGAQLPGILLVSRSNPTPIPGAEGLPTLRRPFSTPALVKVVHEALEDQGVAPSQSNMINVDLAISRIKHHLTEHFPGQEFSEPEIEQFSKALRSDDDLALPKDRPSIRGALGAARLAAAREMLGNSGVRGVTLALLLLVPLVAALPLAGALAPLPRLVLRTLATLAAAVPAIASAWRLAAAGS